MNIPKLMNSMITISFPIPDEIQPQKKYLFSINNFVDFKEDTKEEDDARNCGVFSYR